MTLLDINFGFLGDYPVAGMAEPWISKMTVTLDQLHQKGIRAILTLTEDDTYGDYYRRARLAHHHEPMDDGEPAPLNALERTVDFINTCIANNQPVAAHCLEGRGRTGMVLAAWLGISENIGGPEAIRRTRQLRPTTVLTKAQQACVCEFLEKHQSDK